MKFAWLIFSILATSLSTNISFGAEPTPEVVVTKVRSAILSSELSYPGRVSSVMNAAVQSPTDGIVREIFVTLGSKVKKNQRLFRVKKSEPGFSYAPLTIVAPVEGFVSDLKVSMGSEIARGQQLITLTDPTHLKISVEIAAQDLKLIHIGTVGEFISSTAESSAGGSSSSTAEAQSWPIRLSGVSPQVDPVTGTASVEILLSPNTGLLAGALGQLKINVNSHSGIQLAESALRYRGNKTFVSVVEKGVARNLDVTIAGRSHGLVEIGSGLSDGATVVLRSSSFVSDGDKVKIAEGDDTNSQKTGAPAKGAAANGAAAKK